MKYIVTQNGRPLEIGDELTTFRGKKWIYEGCSHPRKVYVYQGDKTASWPDKQEGEYYPTVFVPELIITVIEN